VRNRVPYFLPIFEYLGALFWVFGFVMLVPLIVLFAYADGGRAEVPSWSYVAPAALALLLGVLLKHRLTFKPLDARRAMLLCALAWIILSALAALPFNIGLGTSYLDAYFESVSGFTTTGITMFEGLDGMPRSLLFWRALTQWVGGLGIFTFFLVVARAGGSAPTLFSAESHENLSKRPAPGLFSTLRILWSIYAAFTALTVAALALEGMSFYDALAHGLTAVSTAGFSTHDASIDYFRQAGYRHFAAIEYTLIAAMVLGGTNFFVHYRVLRGEVRALWDSFEVRLWWLLLAVCVALVALDHFVKFGLEEVGDTLRCSAFQVAALATTTGYATKDLSSSYFPSLAKLIFLILMVTGGCAGSTAGGIKVLRIGVLLKTVGRQTRRALYGHSAVTPIVVDGASVAPEEIRRIAGLFFTWVCLLVVGSGVLALFSDLGLLEAASGMFSALGNIGPSFIPVKAMIQLHPVAKITLILGMLAGRLEILPILLLFSRRAWR